MASTRKAPSEQTRAHSTTPTDAAHLPAPSGIGTATAFDWALGVQLLTQSALLATGRMTLPGMGESMSSAMGAGPSPLLRVAAVVGTLVASAAVFGFGELIRQGNKPAWAVQLAFCSLATLGGVAQLPGTISALQKGQFGVLPTELALLVASPLIVWLLSRPNTRAWVGRVPGAVARARHGGWWVVGILCWAAVGGVLVALGQAKIL